MVKNALMLNWLTIGILSVILLSGCEIVDDYDNIVSVVKEDVKEIDVFFCPRDNCDAELTSFILSAKESVHCAIFDLDLDDVKSALEEKSKEIDVKLVVDSDNFEFVKDFNFVKQDNRSAFMHNKFCIIDGKKITSGSMNPTFNGVYKNNNNLIFINSKYLANNYEAEFDELWNNTFGKGSRTPNQIIYLDDAKVENYFCPEDNCGERIKEALETAEESIYFMTFSFTHEAIANVLLLKNLENVTIKGVFEKRGAGSQYSKYKVLEYQGADVRKDNNSATMHHKVFIIDEKIVVTGSFNPSNNADTRNDENVLIIHDEDIASEYLEEFEYVWDNYAGI